MGEDTQTSARRARPSTATGPRRYRGHELVLPDGGRLRLHADGTIERRDADGSVLSSSRPNEPEWARQAIRFGLRPEPVTVAPQGQRIEDNRLP